MYTQPTVAQFQAQFQRDFPYGTDPNVSVTNADITYAIQMAQFSINPCLWDNQADYNMGFCLLAAHYMVLNLRMASQGINGQYNWAQSSKSVAAVAEGFDIPGRIHDNPDFMMLTKTQYGGQYLHLVLPLICGQMFDVQGRTKP